MKTKSDKFLAGWTSWVHFGDRPVDSAEAAGYDAAEQANETGGARPTVQDGVDAADELSKRISFRY